MGALHEGHLALVRRAAKSGRPVVVSVFVNPTQFGRNDDFDRYPRQMEADAEAAGGAGADIVFAPTVETMYPSPPEGPIPVPPLPAVATEPGLEDAHRPGHFAGVCQVVARLFDLAMPAKAIFGEKDYQQLLVLKAMAMQEGDRWPDLRVIAHETIRDPDGLAMSSRNAYLKPAQRNRALGLSRALYKFQAASSPEEAERLMRETLEEAKLEIDYAVVRHAETLMPIGSLDSNARGVIAAHLGDVRLIDNMALGA